MKFKEMTPLIMIIFTIGEKVLK